MNIPILSFQIVGYFIYLFKYNILSPDRESNPNFCLKTVFSKSYFYQNIQKSDCTVPFFVYSFATLSDFTDKRSLLYYCAKI